MATGARTGPAPVWRRNEAPDVETPQPPSPDPSAAIGGLLRGLLRDGLAVTTGTRLAEIVPADAHVAVAGIGPRAAAIAAGVARSIRGRTVGLTASSQRKD